MVAPVLLALAAGLHPAPQTSDPALRVRPPEPASPTVAVAFRAPRLC